MKICIIGGTGQQGYQQVLAALEQGCEVAAVGQSRTLSREAKLKDEKLSWLKADLLNKSELIAALQAVDYVLINMPSSSFNDENKLLRMFDNILSACDIVAPKKSYLTPACLLQKGI